jgi:hypothetical protein
MRFNNVRVLVDIALGYPQPDKDKQKNDIIKRLFTNVYHPMSACKDQIEQCLRTTSDYEQAYQTAYNLLMPKSKSIYEEECLIHTT